jgi:hypothetical protein
MTFEGRFVKRHYRDKTTGLIKIIFCTGQPVLVPYAEWKARKKFVFHSDGIRRAEVTRAFAHC